jgi:diguanylate cyclase (GGDEF)-like protein
MQPSEQQLNSYFASLSRETVFILAKPMTLLAIILIGIDYHRLFLDATLQAEITAIIPFWQAVALAAFSKLSLLLFTSLPLFKPYLPKKISRILFSSLATSIWLLIITIAFILLNFLSNFAAPTVICILIVQMYIAAMYQLKNREFLIVLILPAALLFLLLAGQFEGTLRTSYFVNLTIWYITLYMVSTAIRQQKVQDLTKSLEIEILNEKLNYYATKDSLTGLFNRRAVDEEFEKRDQKERNQFSLLLIDIDNFKLVNDTYGHMCGDHTIISVVETIQSNCRASDIAGRWGGEEFLVIIHGNEKDRAQIVAEKLRSEIEAKTITFEEQTFQITVTIGVSFSEDDLTLDQALAKADKALYAGKAGGRNRVITHIDEAYN